MFEEASRASGAVLSGIRVAPYVAVFVIVSLLIEIPDVLEG